MTKWFNHKTVSGFEGRTVLITVALAGRLPWSAYVSVTVLTIFRHLAVVTENRNKEGGKRVWMRIHSTAPTTGAQL